MKKISLLIFASLITIWSCKKSKKTETEATTKEIQYTAQDIKTLLDSTNKMVEFSWDSVIFIDDLKMNNIKRLLDEVSYCESADEDKLKELYSLFDTVKSMRYNQDNITGELIDSYDSQQDKLITESNQLAESTPDIEAHPLAIELITEINTIDGITFSKRGDYDNYAREINNTIKNYPDLVKELGAPYTNYKKLGVFGFDDE